MARREYKENTELRKQRKRPDGEVHGPLADRGCQDVFFLLLFFAFWVGMVLVGLIAFSDGDPSLILDPMDYQGNLCGQDNRAKARPWIEERLRADFTEQPVLYYLNLFNYSDNRCLADCPRETTLSRNCLPPYVASFDDYLPGSVDVRDPENDPDCICTYANDPPRVCNSYYASSEIGGRCAPVNTTMIQGVLSDSAAAAKDMFSGAIKDVQRGWHWIAVCGVIALVLGFLFLLAMRVLAGIIVWGTILLVLLLCAGFSYFLFATGSSNKDEATARVPMDEDEVRNAQALVYTSYACMALTFILFCTVIFMRKRIKIAVAIVKYAGKAMGNMPFIIFVPLVAFFAVMAVLAYGIATAVFLYSTGEVQVDGFTREFILDDRLKQLIGYHIFGIIWTILFILAICQTTVAGAVAQFYFTRPGDSVGFFPIWRSFTRVIHYHLGSMAFGSLLIAIVVFIRLVLEYVRRQAKKKGSILEYIMCCIQCTLSCFQRFLEFITSNAYIQIAIFGESFCTAAKRGFTLMTSNILRVVAVSIVGAYIMFLGKIFICVATVMIGWELMQTSDPPIRSYVLAVLIFFMAYAVASVFLAVYESVIKTTLVCFLEDSERNQPRVYAPDSLRELMDVGRPIKEEMTDIKNANEQSADGKALSETKK